MRKKRKNLLLQKNRRATIFLVLFIFSRFVFAADQSPQESASNIKTGLKWSTTYQDSIEEAKAKKQPILIKFEATWCVWCEKMEKEVFTDQEVIKELEKFVCVKVDVDERSNIARAYRIKSLPRTIIVNIHDEIVGDWLGFHEAPVFLKLLRDVNEYTHIQTGTTRMPTVEEKADTSNEIQDIPEINPNNIDNLIGLLGHRNAGICRRVIELLVEAGPEVLPKVAPALESTYLGTRIAAWKVIQELKGEQYKFDPWASSSERAEAARIIRQTVQDTEN